MKKIFSQGWTVVLIFVLIDLFVDLYTSQKNSQTLNLPLQSEISDEELKLKACLLPLEGQGIIIKMDDSNKESKKGEDKNLYLIHDDDLLKVINELRAAGAEAISINGQRLIDTSEIRCAGPTLSVNNVRSSAPFEIHAIGEKNILQNSIKMRGGVADTLKVWGIKIICETSDKIYIPPYKGEHSHVYSRVVSEK